MGDSIQQMLGSIPKRLTLRSNLVLFGVLLIIIFVVFVFTHPISHTVSISILTEPGLKTVTSEVDGIFTKRSKSQFVEKEAFLYSIELPDGSIYPLNAHVKGQYLPTDLATEDMHVSKGDTLFLLVDENAEYYGNFYIEYSKIDFFDIGKVVPIVISGRQFGSTIVELTKIPNANFYKVVIKIGLSQHGPTLNASLLRDSLKCRIVLGRKRVIDYLLNT